jgi:hypothetical protein
MNMEKDCWCTMQSIGALAIDLWFRFSHLSERVDPEAKRGARHTPIGDRSWGPAITGIIRQAKEQKPGLVAFGDGDFFMGKIFPR